jgi:hypothetical protein
MNSARAILRSLPGRLCLRQFAIAVALVAAATAAQAQADVFQGGVGMGSNNTVGSCTPGATPFNGPTPGAVGIVCGDVNGVISARAVASFGHIGANADAVTTGAQGAQIGANAFERSFVTFTSTNPLATTTDVALNIFLAGIVSAGAPAGGFTQGLASGDVRLGNDFFNFSYSFNGDGSQVSRNDMTDFGGGNFTTALVTVAVNTPIIFELELLAEAQAGGANGSARADYFDTLRLPTSGDVFALAPGVTANAGSWLVDNRFIDPLAPVAAVPEPGSAAMLLFGLPLVGAYLRRRHAATARRAPCSDHPRGLGFDG